MKEQIYTLADLQAMPNSALNALAAELRGAAAVETTLYEEWRTQGKNAWVAGLGFPDGDTIPATDWTPTADRNQSGALLECATAQGAGFIIDRFGGSSRIACYQGKDCAWICAISGNDARAETIAFCAAMLAMAERLQ